MGKIGWIVYSVIGLGLLVVAFQKSYDVGFALIIGLVLGWWGGAEFPWEKFKQL